MSQAVSSGLPKNVGELAEEGRTVPADVAVSEEPLAAFMLGAVGVNIGARFLASQEAPIDDDWKQAIIEARAPRPL